MFWNSWLLIYGSQLTQVFRLYTGLIRKLFLTKFYWGAGLCLSCLWTHWMVYLLLESECLQTIFFLLSINWYLILATDCWKGTFLITKTILRIPILDHNKLLIWSQKQTSTGILVYPSVGFFKKQNKKAYYFIYSTILGRVTPFWSYGLRRVNSAPFFFLRKQTRGQGGG